jgi:hypothetical protein
MLETPNQTVSEPQPAFRPVCAPLYPTLDNLESVVALGMSQLPIESPNALRILLLTYHNTLLKVINDEQKADRIDPREIQSATGS